MDKAELARRLRETFQQELSDHVDSLTNELLTIEADVSPERNAESWKTIFRVAHTLKGASAVVNLDAVRDACHAMEEVFGHYRDHRLAMPEAMTSLMLRTVDRFSDIRAQMQASPDIDQSVLDDVLPELQQRANEFRSPASSASTAHESVIGHTQNPPGDPPGPVAERDQPTGASSPAEQAPEAENQDAEPSRLPEAPKSIPGRAAAPVRVPAQKLDSLLSHSGELLIARGRLRLRSRDAAELAEFASGLRSQWKTLQKHLSSDGLSNQDSSTPLLRQTGDQIAALSKRIDALATGMESDDRLLKQTCGRLEDEVHRVRMLPFAEACVGLDRVVRDVAKAGGKSVQLQIEGADVEVDRSVLEGLKDPLLHLVRNAVDHGIESKSTRAESGKPERATVTVSASLRGGQVEVQVADDGRGFDLDRICQIAVQRGLEVPEDPHLQTRLVLHPGFSTAEMITDISGRGVGMDVVQSRIESLHGELNIAFQPGQGTCMTMRVPLTLTTIRCMLVRIGAQQFAIPTSTVERLIRMEAANIRPLGGRDALLVQDQAISLVPLATALKITKSQAGIPESSKSVAIVLSADQRQVAVVVDEVLAEQEVLVKNLGKRIHRLRHFSGCTLLPNGRIALVINAANVVRTAIETRDAETSIRPPSETQQRVKRVLLADDSVTTRILLKNILETAGYVVVEATDGLQALKLFKQQPTDGGLAFDAVVSDVDMPRMNGFELTAQIRQHESAAEIPIVLVTARGTDEDKKQGIMVGANAYIVKGSFDQQNLLNTLTQLV